MIWYLLLIVMIATGDLVIKYQIEKKEFTKDEPILNGHIILTKYHNKGAMLNFLEKQKKVVMYLSGTILGIVLLIFAVLLPSKNNRILKVALALILGGALTNFYDRIKRGYVVDYFSFKWLKNIVFNISDICIFIGAIMSVIKMLLSKRKA